MSCDKYECRMRGIERDRCSDRVMALETEVDRLQKLLLSLPDLRKKSEADAERMWLQINDKESFARQADTSNKLWHEEKSKKEVLVELLQRCQERLDDSDPSDELWVEVNTVLENL